MRLLGFLTFFILTWSLEVRAWESWSPEEMDIFDLVEEIDQTKQNFYEYMELTQEATTSEVRKAYRKLSLVLHPDKNDAEDAEIKFRWFVILFYKIFQYFMKNPGHMFFLIAKRVKTIILLISYFSSQSFIEVIRSLSR